MEQQRTYSIGSVAIMMGVPKYKLRHWCERYLPYTQKIDIGNMQHRRFTGKDSEWIKTIKGYGDGGFTLDAAISQAREHLDGDKCFSLRRTRMQGRALRPPFTLCLGREENRESRAAKNVQHRKCGHYDGGSQIQVEALVRAVSSLHPENRHRKHAAQKIYRQGQ
jgi:DNA-binding transcriptional MerR regulator